MSTTGPLTEQTRAVIEAVLEALDTPPAATVEGAEIRQEILAERLRELLAELRATARSGVIEMPMAWLRERLAEHPVTYVTTDDAHQRLEDGAPWDLAVGS